MKNWKKRGISLLLAVVMMLTLGACGVQSQSDTTDRISFASLQKTGELTLSYATQFQVDYYDPYTLITIEQEGRYLLVPEKRRRTEKLTGRCCGFKATAG